jgi:putative acetyltransferase
MTIRPETPADRDAVRRVHALAFGRAAEADLVDAMRDAGELACSLVALRDQAVVGHVAFSRARLDHGAPVLALAPLGVLPDERRQGFGSALVREGLRLAEATDAALVVVLGDPAFYARFGFAPAAGYRVRAPFPVDSAEAWRAYRLPAWTPGAHGTVVYGAAFAALGLGAVGA